MEAGLLISFPGGDDNCRLIFWMRCFGLGRGKEGLCSVVAADDANLFHFGTTSANPRLCIAAANICPLQKIIFSLGGTAKITDMQMHLR